MRRLNETPDYIDSLGLSHNDFSALPLRYDFKSNMLYVGFFSHSHYSKYMVRVNNNALIKIKSDTYTNDGRLWLNRNILSMWKIDDISSFGTIIDQIYDILEFIMNIIKPIKEYLDDNNLDMDSKYVLEYLKMNKMSVEYAMFYSNYLKRYELIEELLTKDSNSILIDMYSIDHRSSEIYTWGEVKKFNNIRINDEGRERIEHILSPMDKKNVNVYNKPKNTFRKELMKMGMNLFGDSANTIFEYINESLDYDWKGYVDRIPMLKYGVELLYKIEEIGDENHVTNPVAYIVGGTIRDIITGEKEPHDIDIATNVPIEIIGKYLPSYDIGKNKDFGIFVTKYKGFDYEIAQFRVDGTYVDGRRPESVKIVSSYKDDASRRDLTINAMAVDKHGDILDYFNGINDIKNKIIKTVGDPNKRFDEDKLRMMRTIRFASRLGFDIDDETIEAIKRNAPSIKSISNERIMDELSKMASSSGENFVKALKLLDEYGLLKYILPDVAKMKEYYHNVQHHPEGAKAKNLKTGEVEPYSIEKHKDNDDYEIMPGTVWDHVLAAIASNPVKNDLINLAILFHDIGKPNSYQYREGKGHTYYGHEGDGGEIIDKLAKDLHLSSDVKDALKFAAVNHMKMHQFKYLSNKKKYEMISDKNWDVLKGTAKADSMSRGELYDESEWNEIEQLQQEVRDKFKNFNSLNDLKQKFLSGKHIMDVLNMKRGGEIIGKIQKRLLPYIMNNEITDQNQIDDLIKKYTVKLENNN